MPYHGFIAYMSYVMRFMNEVFAHLFDLGSGRLVWTQAAGGIPALGEPSKGQWILSGNLPNMTDKGEDIVAALMTIVHNGIVAVAQFVTLLPYDALP